MIDVDNPWKDKPSVFDKSFCPKSDFMAINYYIDKIMEDDVYFPGLFQRFLIWLYNMRISYPTEPIFLCAIMISLIPFG